MRIYSTLTICIVLILLNSFSLYAVEQRVVRVGAFNYYPGIFKDNDGVVKGFYVDALADIAQRENIRFEYVYGSWNDGLERIKSGEIDVLTSVAFTPERATFLDYGKTPLLTVWGELYTPLTSEIDGIREVQGKKIAVMKGDFNGRHFIELVKKFNISCEFLEMSGFDDVFKAVAAKKVDAGVVNSTFGVAKQKEYGLRSTGVVFNPFDIFIAVAKGKNNAQLLLLDGYLDAWKHQKDSPFIQARQKWSHGNINESFIIPRWLIVSVAGLAMLSLCASIFVVVLKRKVRSKTFTAIESAKQYKILSERQNAILAAVPDIIMEVDTNRVYTWANSAGLEFFGQDAVGKEAAYYFEREQNTYEIVQPLFIGEENTIYVESWQRRRDGEVRLLGWWCRSLVDENNSVTGTLSTARDITDSKRIEDELRTSAEDLKESQQIAHVGSWRLDLASNSVKWSEELYRMYGFDPNLPPPPFTEHQKLFTSESWEKLSAALHNTQQTGIPYDLELEMVRGNERSGWMWAYGMSIQDSSGVTIGLRGIAQDITERKQIEEVQSYLLRISSISPDEDFFELLARYLANILGMDYVCIDSLHGDRLSAQTLAIFNDGKFQDNVEYTLKDTPCGDVVGKEVCVFPREVRKLFPQDAALQDLQAESYVGTTLWSFDMKPIGLIAVIGRKELNSSYFAEAVLKLVSIRAAGELDRRNAEEAKLLLEQQMQQTQKLESLGVLAGGIAHDFNNILAIIFGNCALAKMGDKNAGNYIPEIEKASERAAELCRQMLAYAGKAQFVQAKINFQTLVEEMVEMLKKTIPQNAEILLDSSIDLPMIKGDASQLNQIVMNLIINASEAIGNDQGKISVSLTRTKITAEHSEKDYYGKTISAGDFVSLEVTDDGCGMDDDTKWRIFEPFYTTKFTGRGLGMSAVLGIIMSHKGALQLYSQLGQGTTFKVFLPALQSDYSSDYENQKQPISSVSWKGIGTVLLVEDEDQIRCIAKTLLEMFGLTVVEAVNGKQALDLYLENIAEISLVVTDMGMPIMDGYALFHALKRLDPALPIIISSGFGDADVTSRIDQADIAGLISKPYTLDTLREVLKRVVEGASQ